MYFLQLEKCISCSHLDVVACAYNLLKGIFEGCTSYKESINIWLLDKLISILVCD